MDATKKGYRRGRRALDSDGRPRTSLSITLPAAMVERIDATVDAGHAESRSDFIRKTVQFVIKEVAKTATELQA